MLTLPPISARNKAIVVGVAIIIAFAAGRYSVQSPKIVTTIATQTNTQEQQKQDTHTKTTITETKQPNGVDTKVTTIDQVKDTALNLNQDSNTQIQQVVTPPRVNTLNISVLG